jgi:polyhydroxybutyrate depolymerase
VIIKLVHSVFTVAALVASLVSGREMVHLADQKTQTLNYSMKVGDLTRTWEEITPTSALPKSAPIIVFLSGKSATLSVEIPRDFFMPFANADDAELVYPVDYKGSWNAGGCCGDAATANIDDVAFLKALAARVDPGHTRPIYLVGYSNGGRMAYRMACSAPGFYDAYAIAKADPQPGCVISKPTTILQISSVNDTEVPYTTGDKGHETPTAVVQHQRLLAEDKCGAASSTVHSGWLTYTVWDCADGTRLGYALYSSGGHQFPPPKSYEPAASAVAWAFFANAKSIEPLPA